MGYIVQLLQLCYWFTHSNICVALVLHKLMIVWYISVAIEISDQEAAEMSNFDSWDSLTNNR